MSYDLLVFEPEAAPKSHRAFLCWYMEAMEADDGICFTDTAIASAPLRAWYADMVQRFPDLNGPAAEDVVEEDASAAADYSIGKDAIYACFAWSKVEPAYRACFELAEKHRLGFFDPQHRKEQVWLPTPSGLKIAHQRSLLDRIANLFRKT